MSGGIYALIALGIVVIYKASGIFNLAVGAIVAMGCLLGWGLLVQAGLPLPVVLVVLFIVALVLGLVVERSLMRPLYGQPPLSALMITLALMEIVGGITILIWPGIGRIYPPILPTGTVRIWELVISVESLINFIMCMLIFGILVLFFQYTKVGLAMRATAEDQQLAQSGGIRVTTMVSMAWFIAIIAGFLGGVILGPLYGADVTSISILGLKAFPAVIIGGLQSIPGAIIGGLLVGISETMGAGYLDPYVAGGMADIVPFVVLLVILLIKPYGLFGYERIERV